MSVERDISQLSEEYYRFILGSHRVFRQDLGLWKERDSSSRVKTFFMGLWTLEGEVTTVHRNVANHSVTLRCIPEDLNPEACFSQNSV